jgi:hypothetical protein
MKRQKLTPRTWLLLAALVGAGGLGGLYLGRGHDAAPAAPAGRPAGPAAAAVHRFPLSTLDAKDTVEGPDVAVDASGRIVLAWGSKTGETERTVFVTTSGDAGESFSAPTVLSKAGIYRSAGRSAGKGGGHERRAQPHVVCAEGTIHVAWSEALPDGAGMQMLHAGSTDGTVSFSPAQPLNQNARANATFTALAAGPGGALAGVWLSDEAGYQQPFAALRPTARGAFEPERLVHPGEAGKGVCPCCPTAACFASDGTLFVAYRDIRAGFRDIAVARRRVGQAEFETPVPVVPSTWKFDGCPHDGPSLALAGDVLHVAFMDAHTGRQRCYHAQAPLSELKFETRELHKAGPGTQGNARLRADAAGGIHAVWEESLGAEPADEHAGHKHGAPTLGGSGRAVQYAYLAPGQSELTAPRAVCARPGAYQMRPALAVGIDGAVWIAWNELSQAGKAVVVTKIAAPTIFAQGDQP